MQVAIQSGASALTLEVEQFGTPEKGTIILIMGLGTQLIAWPMTLCRGLADAGFRVIRYDNRDVGLSSKFDAAGVPDVRAAILRRLLHLPVKAPYRLTTIMSSPGAPLPWDSTAKAREVLMEPVPPNATAEEVIRMRMNTYRVISGPDKSLPDTALYQLAKQSIERSMDSKGSRRQLVAATATGSLKRHLRDIRVPTLIIHGKADPLIPAKRSEDLHRGIAGSKLLLLDGMGHSFPEAFIALMVEAILANCARADPTATAQLGN